MKLVVVGLLVTLTGCVTVPSKIISVGPNSYTLNMTGVGFATQGNTNIKALSEASAFCDSQQKKLLVKNSAESGVYGWSPRQSTLTFQCLSADDPEYVRSMAAKGQ
ncbi:MAG: hypothetical protein ACYDBZ_00470 [Steroidobacteraceae bacterium]